jgi:hypothetical protein
MESSQWARTLLRALVLLTCGSAVSACEWFESEEHILPQGYVGPVVILFSRPTADAAEPRQYKIPTNGVLCFKGTYRRSNEARRQFYYEAEDGKRSPLRYGAGSGGEVHVYGFGDGRGLFLGRPNDIRRYFVYMVGASEQSNWQAIRDEASLSAEDSSSGCPLAAE